jgi:ACT domain-containing protein
MILPKATIDYFKLLSSKVNKGKAQKKTDNPYMIQDDQTILNYECIRDVWYCSKSISSTCKKHNISRTTYYQLENNFVNYGLPGLFYFPRNICEEVILEKFVLLIKECRPSLSQIAILRLVQCLPLTKDKANPEIISSILTSYGYGQSHLESDTHFWGRIQRSLSTLENLLKTRINGRDVKERKKTFFVDKDIYHKKLELLRDLYYSEKPNIMEACIQYNISVRAYSRLRTDYEMYGIWSIIPSLSYGQKFNLLHI